MDMEEFPERFDPVEVGARLREARIALRRGQMDVARDLRIRQVYIEAIEEGRFEDLPGLAYQTGFLRAYGNYLGLDGAEIADRLKSARDTTASPAELQVFSPVDEGHLPTRSVLLLAGLLAIAVYGVWYFVANTEGDPMERVAALPDRLASLLEGKPDPDTGGAAPPATAAPPPTPQRSPRAADNAGGASGEATLAAVTEPSAPVPELRAETPARPPATPTPRPEPEPAAQPAGPDDPAAPSDRPAANPSTDPSTDPSTEVTTAALPAPSPPAADEDSGATQPPGAEPGNADAVPRLILRAVADSWIEIQSDDAPPLYSGLLREGESYAVPERQGLKLVTGNAGGLEILVDGQVMPRLGPPGAVMRDIDLDGVRRRNSG